MRVECRHATYLTTTTTRAPDIFTYLFSIDLSAATRNFLQYWPLDNLGSYSEFLCILWLSLFGSTSTEVLATLYHERVEVPRRKQIGWKCWIRGPRQTSHSTHLVGHSRARKVFSGLDSSRWGIIWLWFAQINCSCPTYSCDERLWNRLRWIFPRKYVLEALLYHKTQNSEG